jgi:tetratricopeptide (TPR) repeat protein
VSGIQRKCFLALLLTTAASAADWVRIKSPNFELFTTAGEKKGREAILYFEQVRATFDKLAKSGSSSTLPVRIIAFRSDKEFDPYRINDFATAYYLGSRDRDYIVMRSISAEYYPVALHEYTHLIIKHTELPLPIWLNEGLAEVFSTLRPLGKQVILGALIPGRLQELATGKWLPLETLTAVDHQSPLYNEKAKAGMFYSESWALTHMLYFSTEYWKNFGELIKRIRPDASQDAVFREVYGKSLAEVRVDLDRYMRGDRFNQAVADVKLEKSAESPEVRPATELESGMALAELLAVTRKRGEASAAYASLAKQYPKEAEVEVAMAKLGWMHGDRDEMKLHFARAIELGTKNAKVYYDYAMMLRESGAAEPEVSGMLRRALDLQPDLQDASYLLGFNAMTAGRFGEAVALLSQVKKIEPAHAFHYFRALAYSNYRLGRQEQAKRNAESALKYAKEPDDVKLATELLAYVSQDHSKSPESAATPASHAEDRPLLTRRGPEPPPTAEPATPVDTRRTYPVTGTLEAVDCLDKMARLRVLAGGKRMALLIEDPNKIAIIHGGAGGAHEFSCGPQKSVPVTLEYVLQPDAQYKTEGLVRSIEFR